MNSPVENIGRAVQRTSVAMITGHAAHCVDADKKCSRHAGHLSRVPLRRSIAAQKVATGKHTNMPIPPLSKEVS